MMQISPQAAGSLCTATLTGTSASRPGTHRAAAARLLGGGGGPAPWERPPPPGRAPRAGRGRTAGSPSSPRPQTAAATGDRARGCRLVSVRGLAPEYKKQGDFAVRFPPSSTGEYGPELGTCEASVQAEVWAPRFLRRPLAQAGTCSPPLPGAAPQGALRASTTLSRRLLLSPLLVWATQAACSWPPFRPRGGPRCFAPGRPPALPGSSTGPALRPPCPWAPSCLSQPP